MKVKKLTPELMVEDVTKTVQFYQAVLSFEVIVSVPEEQPFFVILANGQAEVMIYQREYFASEIPKFAQEKVGGSIALYLEIDDIQAAYQAIKNKVTLIQDLHTTDYGSTEFSFEDCNGYVIMLAERDI